MFFQNLSVVASLHFINVGNVVNCDKLEILHTINVERKPIIYVLVNNATVQRVVIGMEEPLQSLVDAGITIKRGV